jgi:hypothetical protein
MRHHYGVTGLRIKHCKTTRHCFHITTITAVTNNDAVANNDAITGTTKTGSDRRILARGTLQGKSMYSLDLKGDLLRNALGLCRLHFEDRSLPGLRSPCVSVKPGCGRSLADCAKVICFAAPVPVNPQLLGGTSLLSSTSCSTLLLNFNRASCSSLLSSARLQLGGAAFGCGFLGGLSTGLSSCDSRGVYLVQISRPC